ncbi:MAG TPA: hypothetical protein VMS43_07140 [Allosphingosinicella sp.]|nr:hypothetical protein [Allosphingosinicella sp.]
MPDNLQDDAAPTKKPMAAWFDPRLLAATGFRSVISGLFGHFADKREAIAAANAIQPTPADGEFDYSRRNPGGDFWFDYLADTGDGWNPTFAMARLANEDTLTADELPRGDLLILGGDQVYPTASREEYRDRFVNPYDYAYDPGGAPRWPDDKDRPHLYAIPGNHDWYDGLNSFFGLFCRRRVVGKTDLGISRNGKVIGGRRTQQTRSYFAIALPNGWWVWGTDCQLEGYIDQPQIDYFQHAAAHWMKPGSKLILCVADPAWAHVDPKDPDKKFESFSYLERLAGLASMPDDREGREETWPAPGAPMGHILKLVLTGDSHHYCRYVEYDEDPVTPARHYVVCGGGGAFLHPTHQLEDSCFDYRFPKPGVPADSSGKKHPREFKIPKSGKGEEPLFPDRKTSKKLSWGNFAFAWKNKLFVLTLFFVYGFFNWILDFNSGIARGEMLVEALRHGGLCDAIWLYWTVLVPTTPWSALLVLISLLAYKQFADSKRSKPLRWVMGAAHASLQAAVVTLTTIAVMRWPDWMIANPWTDWIIAHPRLDSIVSVALATFASAILSGVTFGLYLWFCIRWLGRHPNEGFSSMRIEDYKSFLRLRIDKDGGLTIFPIGLKEVPKGNDGGALDHHLIEPPIPIKP